MVFISKKIEIYHLRLRHLRQRRTALMNGGVFMKGDLGKRSDKHQKRSSFYPPLAEVDCFYQQDGGDFSKV